MYRRHSITGRDCRRNDGEGAEGDGRNGKFDRLLFARGKQLCRRQHRESAHRQHRSSREDDPETDRRRYIPNRYRGVRFLRQDHHSLLNPADMSLCRQVSAPRFLQPWQASRTLYQYGKLLRYRSSGLRQAGRCRSDRS